MVFVNERDKSPRRTIDYDRNAILYNTGSTGGSSENIEKFELHWNGGVVNFLSRLSTIDNGKNGDLHHELIKLDIPNELTSEADEIFALIKDALDAFGTYWHREKVDNVSVSLSPEIKP